MNRKIIICSIAFVLVLFFANMYYFFVEDAENIQYPGELLESFESISFYDSKSEYISVREIECNSQIRLIWDFSLEDLQTKLNEDDLYCLIAKTYIVNLLIDGVNFASFYNLDLKDAIFLVVQRDEVETSRCIDEFIDSVIIRKCLINVPDRSKLEKMILSEYNRIFDDFFDNKFTNQYYQELLNKYIDDEIQYLTFLRLVQYVQMYEDYYFYYMSVNRAMHKRQKEEFIDKCILLYCYVGECTMDEVRTKYMKFDKTDVENELKEIVPSMIEMFGNYRENEFLQTAVTAANEIDYQKTMLHTVDNQKEYNLSEEDIIWGTNLFWGYMEEKIYE